MSVTGSFVTPAFVCILSVCHASIFGISLRDLCSRRLLTRSTSATNLGTMKARVEVRRDSLQFDTVHRALINRQ